MNGHHPPHPIFGSDAAGTEPGLQAVWHYLVKKILIQLKVCKRSPCVLVGGSWDNGVTKQGDAVNKLLMVVCGYFPGTLAAPESFSASRIR